MKWIRISYLKGAKEPPDNVPVLLYVEETMIEGFFKVERTPTGRVKWSAYEFNGSNGCDCQIEPDAPTHWALLPNKPEGTD